MIVTQCIDALWYCKIHPFRACSRLMDICYKRRASQLAVQREEKEKGKH
jgi:hypothetical protein